MLKLKCIAIDDEPPALEVLRVYIEQQPGLQLLHCFDDAVSGGEFLRNHEVDLVFLDINMPDINGIDLARSLADPPMIIFTTAYKKFAFEGFELNAVDYLLKPVSPERFGKAVSKAIEYHQYKNNKDAGPSSCLFVHSEYRMIKIPVQQITYIESLEDYVRIHLVDEKPVMSLIPLKKVLERLPQDQFFRIHRSYIVSIDKVTSIQNRKVQLGDVELPVSETYAGFIEKWKRR